MSDTPGADSGAVHGWAMVALGVGMALALRGEGQAVGAIVAGVGLAIVAFAGATKPLERAVNSNAGGCGGWVALGGLCLLVVVGLLAIVGAGAGVAGGIP